MDVRGRVWLADGTEPSVVTGIDDHSRFCVSAILVPRATAGTVCAALVAAMPNHGIPDAVLTPNGKVLTGRSGVAKTRGVAEDRVLVTENFADYSLLLLDRLHADEPCMPVVIVTGPTSRQARPRCPPR